MNGSDIVREDSAAEKPAVKVPSTVLENSGAEDLGTKLEKKVSKDSAIVLDDPVVAKNLSIAPKALVAEDPNIVSEDLNI